MNVKPVPKSQNYSSYVEFMLMLIDKALFSRCRKSKM